jgi:Na+/proline symporter
MVIHQMNLKEKIVYVIGSIVVIYGAFAGRDLTNLSELIEGSAMVALIVSIFIVFVYINRRGIGDWHPKYND